MKIISRILKVFSFKTNFTGVAWLSSARVVRCLVKSFNERNSYSLLVKTLTFLGFPLKGDS